MFTLLRPAFVMLVLFTIATGLIYPLAVTAIVQAIFPKQANGSLIEVDGQLVGSELIGQSFNDPRYFWGRPSATSPFPYSAAASSGSNLGPTNPVLGETILERIQALQLADPGNTQTIPVDLVTASGSGLDPHISLAAALYQIPRIVRERGISEERLNALVDDHTKGRQLGILGEPRVNVLLLNLALDGIK